MGDFFNFLFMVRCLFSWVFSSWGREGYFVEVLVFVRLFLIKFEIDVNKRVLGA